MGSICATQTIPTINVDKGDSCDKERSRSNRVKRYSQTSFDQEHPKQVTRSWMPHQATPMPKGIIVLTPEPSQLTVDENNGARLSVSTHASGSEVLSVSGSSMRSSTDYSSSLSTGTMASKITEKWKAPIRLESLDPEMRALLLGHLEKPDKLLPRPKVLHLKVIAPANDCMKLRLSLWEHAFKALRLEVSERDYVLDIQDDMWLSVSLNKNYFPLADWNEMPPGADSHASIWAVDAVLIVLTDTLDSRLPDCLNQDEYTLILDGIQEEDMSKLFCNLYINENNRQPPLYTLQRRFMIKQEWREIYELILFMMNHFTKAKKDASVFYSNYHSQLNTIFTNKSLLSKKTVVVMRSLTRVLNLDEVSTYPMDIEPRFNNGDCLNQMDQVKEAVEKHCDPTNIIQLELPLRDSRKHTNKFDTDLHLSLQHQMSVAVKERFSLLLEDLIEEDETKGRNIVTGVPFSLVEELASQTAFRRRLTNVEPLHTSTALLSLQEYISGFSEKPLVVFADPGWGLSTLAAQLHQHCAKTVPQSCIVYRSIGLTPDTRTLMSTLMSIQQQLDVILGDREVKTTKQDGENTPFLKTLLRDIVTRSTQNLPLVIILDGVFLESSQLKQLEVMTLTECLPTNTRLVVMTSDPGVARGLRLKMKDALSIKASPWEKQLVANLLSKTVSNQNLWLSEAQNTLLANAIKKCPLPLFASVAGKIISEWTFIQQEKEEELPTSIEGIVNKLFDLLESHLPSASFVAMMSHLSGSVGGITTWEMNDLLSVNDTVLLSVYSDEKNPPIHRAPSILWKSVSFQIQHFLHVFVSERFYSYCWASGTVSRCAAKRYLSGSTISTSQQREICDHFQGRWADKKKPYPCPEEEIERLEDRFIMAQPDDFGLFPNVRKLLCLPHHTMQSKNKNNFALETFIIDIPWIIRKMACVSIVQVLIDLEEAKSMENSYACDIKTMQYLIYSSFNSLFVKSSEVCKILHKHVRSSKDSTRNKVKCCNSQSGISTTSRLYQNIESLNDLQLFPLDEELPSFSFLQSSLVPLPAINAISPIDEKASHLALVFKNEGEIRIVNCKKNMTVRTLTSLSHPSTLKMLDSTTAVVLCNRELCVINLDEGKLITKLRGVLNLRMPYFGLQNNQRVVALSRDRMVVNVMDIIDGSIVASFKAGETRFLDSLLISKNGSIVVCGDETQKPFPLLVWSLDQNKLLHDIRMSQHEFITRLADLTNDGLYLACGCKEINSTDLNFVIVYDLKSGQLFRKFKMAAQTTALALCSKSLSLVVALDTGQLVVWDIVSGTTKFVMTGVNAAIDTLLLTSNGQRCLSYCAREFSISSYTIGLWDLEKGQLLGAHTFQAPVTAAYLTPDGDTIWVGVKACVNPIRLVLVGEKKERADEETGIDIVLSASGDLREREKEEEAQFGDVSREGAVIQVNL